MPPFALLCALPEYFVIGCCLFIPMSRKSRMIAISYRSWTSLINRGRTHPAPSMPAGAVHHPIVILTKSHASPKDGPV
jgi:hypothetical protein